MSRRINQLNKSQEFIKQLDEELINLYEFKIKLIKDYLIIFDKYLTEKTVETEKKIDEWENSELGKDSRYDGMDRYGDDYRKYDFEFKVLKLESTFLISFASFEIYLKKICKHHSDFFKFKIGVNDLKGNNDIEKCHTYLKKVVKLDLCNKLWKEITHYKKIRNKIIHNNSNFNISDDKDLIKELSEISGILFLRSGKFYLSDNEFIFNFFKLIEEYIQGIIHITEEKINKTD